jgi:DNA-binding SARP family transcriptional activator
VESGYLHVESGRHAEIKALRPWLLPLGEGWFWLRPSWRPALVKELTRLSRDGAAISAGAIEDASLDRHAALPASEHQSNHPSTGDSPSVLRQAVEIDTAAQQPDADRRPAAHIVHRPILKALMLGTFELTIDGTPVVSWEGTLGPMMLKYLLTRETHSAPRDLLMSTFWPEVDPSKARNRLHVAMSALRRSLRAASEATIVEFSNTWYRINPELDTQIDVEEFRSSTQTARTRELNGAPGAAIPLYLVAIELYRGDFLAEIPYEEWTLLPREALRMKYVEALDRAAPLLESADRIEECIAVAQKTLEQDSCSEHAHRLLMRSFARLGHEHLAIRQFEMCQQTLDRVLASRPSPETVREYLAISGRRRRNE